MKAARRCTWCKSPDHTDRDRPDGSAVCPGRAAWRAEREAEVLRQCVQRGPCSVCGDETATTEVFLSKVNEGGSFWAGPRCVAMFEQLAVALGGRPSRRSAPSLRVVR